MAKTSWLVIHWSSTMSFQRHTIINVMCRMICQTTHKFSELFKHSFCNLWLSLGWFRPHHIFDRLLNIPSPPLSPSCRPGHSYGGHTGLQVVLRLTYLTKIWVFFASTFFCRKFAYHIGTVVPAENCTSLFISTWLIFQWNCWQWWILDSFDLIHDESDYGCFSSIEKGKCLDISGLSLSMTPLPH